MVFQIKTGLSKHLISPEGVVLVEVENGCWYLTTDTHKLYVGINNDLVAINDAETFDPTELQTQIDNLDTRVDILESTDVICGGTSAEFN